MRLSLSALSSRCENVRLLSSSTARVGFFRGNGGRGDLSRLASIVIKLVVHVMAAYLRHKCHMLNGLSRRYFCAYLTGLVYGL